MEGYDPAKEKVIQAATKPDTVEQLLLAKDELIAAQRQIIQAYEKQLEERGRKPQE